MTLPFEDASPWRPTPLAPLLKWPGGKSTELPHIRRTAPPTFSRLIDPFVGGASIPLALADGTPFLAGDTCGDLVELYRAITSPNSAVLTRLISACEAWDGLTLSPCKAAHAANLYRHERWAELVDELAHLAHPCLEALGLPANPQATEADVADKLHRIQKTEIRKGRELPSQDLTGNLETAVRAAVYYRLRDRFNRPAEEDAIRVTDFFLIRELAYASMFRYNRNGQFNVPYGGMSYNAKSLSSKARRFRDPEIASVFGNGRLMHADFEVLLKEACPSGDDFVFVDPPYDSDFSTYAGSTFDSTDQARLAHVLSTLAAPVMVVIKKTPLIEALYAGAMWRIVETDKTYMWTIKERNDRVATHLIITNY